MIQRLIGILAVLFLTPPLALAQAKEPPTVLIMGDSLSAAYGLPVENGWVSLLKQRLAQQKYVHQVINASISGETTAGGRQRLDSLLKQYRPTVVVIELGANDGLRGLSLEQSRDNLEQMIATSKQARARVLLVGMRLPSNYGPAYTEPFHAMFSQLARQHHIALVPFLLEGTGGRREHFQPDGMHPSAAAQPLLLDAVWPHLRPQLKN